MNLNAEYYYTDFRKQVVVDMDTDRMPFCSTTFTAVPIRR